MWVVAFGTPGAQASYERLYAWHTEPHGYPRLQAEVLMERGLKVNQDREFEILPYPPPAAKPVAVQFAVRDRIGDWWDDLYFARSVPAFFDSLEKAQATIDLRNAGIVRTWKPVIVGFGPDGKEVEVER